MNVKSGKSVSKKCDLPETVIIKMLSLNNNFRVDIVSLRGDVLLWKTAGSQGFKNSKKNTPLAAVMVVNSIMSAAYSRGVRRADAEIRGFGIGRDSAIRAMCDSDIQIDSITEKTPIPHNGVRPKKARRV